VLTFTGTQEADTRGQRWAGGQDAESAHHPHVVQSTVLLQETGKGTEL